MSTAASIFTGIVILIVVSGLQTLMRKILHRRQESNAARIMRRTAVLGLLFCAVLFSGCAGQARLVRELSKDPATVRLKITSMWATVDFERTGLSTNTVPR